MIKLKSSTILVIILITLSGIDYYLIPKCYYQLVLDDNLGIMNVMSFCVVCSLLITLMLSNLTFVRSTKLVMAIKLVITFIIGYGIAIMAHQHNPLALGCLMSIALLNLVGLAIWIKVVINFFDIKGLKKDILFKLNDV